MLAVSIEPEESRGEKWRETPDVNHQKGSLADQFLRAVLLRVWWGEKTHIIHVLTFAYIGLRDLNTLEHGSFLNGTLS
jgi:hypothetical protein